MTPPLEPRRGRGAVGVGNWKQTEQRDQFNADSFDTRGVTSFNEYTVAAGATLDYDDNGNLMNDEKNLHYHWDAFNRLHRVTDANDATTATYTYDTDGRRLMKDLSGTTSDVSFAYDGWQVILEYAGAAGLPLRQYTYGAFINEPLFMDVADGNGEFLDEGDSSPLERYSFLQTPIYNVAALVDYDTQELVERYDYDPYGKYTLVVGDTRTELGQSLVGNSMTFTGHWFDRETGMYWMRKRYFTANGFFSQRDLIDMSYKYCNNSPIFSFDIYGLWGIEEHEWVTKLSSTIMGIPNQGKNAIAHASGEIDDLYPTQDVSTALMINISDSNWAWHFNRSGGGTDSRLALSERELIRAMRCCDWRKKKDDWAFAAMFMGHSLHPDQDWVAHGDFNRKTEMPSLTRFSRLEARLYWHNWAAGYNGWGTRATPFHLMPDDLDLDANGPNGRPTIDTMDFHGQLDNQDKIYATDFHPGNQRQNLTIARTKLLLTTFQVFVRYRSKSCGECQKAFMGPDRETWMPDQGALWMSYQ